MYYSRHHNDLFTNLQVKCLVKEREESSPLCAGSVFLRVWKFGGGDNPQRDVGVGLALGVGRVYGHLRLVQVGLQAGELGLDPFEVPLGSVHVHVGLGLQFPQPRVFISEAAPVDLRGLEVTRVQDLHSEVIPEQLRAHGDAAELVVAHLQGALLLHAVPVISRKEELRICIVYLQEMESITC